MKKLTLFLAGFLIAGWAIFAIQSYASSQGTILSESEINKLKSTYPKNNNRLSAEMRDTMLNLLNKIRSKIENMEKQFTTINKKLSEQKGLTINRKSYDYGGGDSISKTDLYKTKGIHPPIKYAIAQDPEKALSNAYRFFDDGPNGLWNSRRLGQLTLHSIFLWNEHQFCSLSLVAMSPYMTNADQICYVYKDVNGWRLYENDRWAWVYCQATCF